MQLMKSVNNDSFRLKIYSQFELKCPSELVEDLNKGHFDKLSVTNYYQLVMKNNYTQRVFIITIIS